MKKIEVYASSKYNVIIKPGILKEAGLLAMAELSPKFKKVCIITDSTVADLYLEKAIISFAKKDTAVFNYVVEAGEKSKTLKNAENIVKYLFTNEFSRDDIVVSLGGGVVGDLAGFASSIYMRGIRFIQIPTTLLAMVDSSVGGKTAVNLGNAKNIIGSFYQPQMVLCDPSLLKTLPSDVYAQGMAEAIKMGVLTDTRLFNGILDKTMDISDIIYRCVSWKADIISEDEKEIGVRTLLNLGHTVAHAVEKASKFKISHGEAVAIGLYTIAKAGENKILSEKIAECLINNNLPLTCDISPDKILSEISSDKKKSGDTIKLVIPLNIAKCNIKEMPIKEAKEYLRRGFYEN